MRTAIVRFAEDESGATAIEYALIAAGISVAILVAVNSVGTKLTAMFNTIADRSDAGEVVIPTKQRPASATGSRPFGRCPALKCARAPTLVRSLCLSSPAPNLP